jgi:hypothetical protein
MAQNKRMFVNETGEEKAISHFYGVVLYDVLSESYWTVTVVTALVKEDERGGQGHTSASLLH